MQFILKNNDKKLILENGDVIEIQLSNKKSSNLHIECRNNMILIDEVSDKRIKEIKIEQEQLAIMNKHNQKK